MNATEVGIFLMPKQDKESGINALSNHFRTLAEESGKPALVERLVISSQEKSDGKSAPELC